MATLFRTKFIHDAIAQRHRPPLIQSPMIFQTARLIIRDYRPEDRAICAAIAAHPRVRAFHYRSVSRAESDAFIDRQRETIRSIGCGYAVVERKADGTVLGDVGIRPLPSYIPFSRDVKFEIGCGSSIRNISVRAMRPRRPRAGWITAFRRLDWMK